MNRYDLAGQVAAVTGGARGIGLAIAERLLESGAKVSLWDADGEEAAFQARRLGCHAAPCDVTDERSLDAALRATEASLGPVTTLVANAGITGPNHLLEDYPVEAWRRVVEVDLVGVFLSCRAVLPGMRSRNFGRIVVVASVAGKEGNPNASAYSAAKAGAIALVKSLGKETAATGIRANAIAPAAVETDLFAQMTAEQVAWMKSKIPMGRFGLKEEVAAMAAFLCSPEASFSTGAVFDLSGGRATY